MTTGITSNLSCSKEAISDEVYGDHKAVSENSATTIKKENVKWQKQKTAY